MIEIPYRAWSIELTSDYAQRNRIQVWIGVAMMLGPLLFYMVPLIGKSIGLTETTEFDLTSLGLAAVIVVLLLPPLNLLALKHVPDGLVEPAPAAENWRSVWQSIAGNGPLLQFTAMFLVVSFCSGMQLGVMYLFVDVYLGLSQQLAGLMVATIPITLLTIPLWGWLCTRFERNKVWAISVALLAFSAAGNSVIPRGEAGLALAAFFYLIGVSSLVASLVAAPAMLGDIADYGRLKFRQDRAGTYYAFYTLIVKTVQGFAAGFGMVVIGWLGFDASAAEQSASGVFAIKLVASWIPALGSALTVILIWKFPINRARHAEIVAQLKQRTA